MCLYGRSGGLNVEHAGTVVESPVSGACSACGDLRWHGLCCWLVLCDRVKGRWRSTVVRCQASSSGTVTAAAIIVTLAGWQLQQQSGLMQAVILPTIFYLYLPLSRTCPDCSGSSNRPDDTTSPVSPHTMSSRRLAHSPLSRSASVPARSGSPLSVGQRAPLS